MRMLHAIRFSLFRFDDIFYLPLIRRLRFAFMIRAITLFVDARESPAAHSTPQDAILLC